MTQANIIRPAATINTHKNGIRLQHSTYNYFDAICIGGGPVGLLTAYMLATKGFSVAVLDRADYESTLDPAFDGRTFAYAHGSKTILESHGLWKDLAPHATPINDIYVTADHKNFLPKEGLHYQASQIKIDGFETDDSNGTQNHMGYNIETRFFRKHTYKRLKTLENVTFFAPSKIISIDRSAPKASVTLESDHIIKAPLLIGCDGKQSAIRDHAGLKTITKSYGQKAIVGLIRHEKSHNHTAYEHFLKSGPLAILPMQDEVLTHSNHATTPQNSPHRSGFIWSLSNDRADYFHGLSNQDLSHDLEHYFKDILGSIGVYGNRWLFPLDVQIVKGFIADRLVLVGDAAHSIHPVAGQGFNLGIRDADALTTHLTKAKTRGLDIGSHTVLSAYEASRKQDVLSMTAMCHGLVRLFSNSNRTLDHTRKTGLKLTNALPSLKNKLTKHAMGLS